MRMDFIEERRKGYVVCGLMVLISCLYLFYPDCSLYHYKTLLEKK